jgi:hypothetical protein
MLHRFRSAVFLLLGVIFLDRVAFAEMTLFDFNQLQPSSKRQANSYMTTIESYMEGVYGSDVSVARGAMAAAGMGNLGASDMTSSLGLAPSVSSPDTFLLNGKGKNAALALSFGSSPINSFAVDWEVFRKGTGITIKADGVVIFQDLLTKSEKKTGISDRLAPVFFDNPIHTLEFVGIGKSKIGIDNLAVNIPQPNDGSGKQYPASGNPAGDDASQGNPEGGGYTSGGGFPGDNHKNGSDYSGQQTESGGWYGSYDNGGSREFDSQVPEPATFILLAVGLLVVGTFGRSVRPAMRPERHTEGWLRN